VLGIFQIGSCELFLPGWLQTTILLISASLVARITGVSHLAGHWNEIIRRQLIETCMARSQGLLALSPISQVLLPGWPLEPQALRTRSLNPALLRTCVSAIWPAWPLCLSLLPSWSEAWLLQAAHVAGAMELGQTRAIYSPSFSRRCVYTTLFSLMHIPRLPQYTCSEMFMEILYKQTASFPLSSCRDRAAATFFIDRLRDAPGPHPA
jgi:hypothetical protein